MNVKQKLRIMDEIKEANRQHLEDWKREQEIGDKIKGVLVDVERGCASVVTLDKTLDAYYRALNCRTIDIVRRRIGGRVFDIICDDEALLTGAPTSFSTDGYSESYGNALNVDSAEKQMNKLVGEYLWGEKDDNGVHLLYRGLS